ncbi:MAG: VapC toxin family PIN domain ribonuclease [Deltaproteobacteria bacterium]|nr:MAG: VapC toxin family PIN domain ribonuclease [Deltaproteobacteria bacterium]
MILVDANILIYAKVSDFAQHEIARAWLEARLGEPGKVGLPWPVLLSFLRITTNPRIFARPLATAEAWAQVDEWLSLPGVWTPLPTERHAEVLGRLLVRTGSSANLVPDAHLAALAIEHGLVMCSSDGDFTRFPGLRYMNPLSSQAQEVP